MSASGVYCPRCGKVLKWLTDIRYQCCQGHVWVWTWQEQYSGWKLYEPEDMVLAREQMEEEAGNG